MKRIVISDLAALRAACQIMPTLYGLDREGIEYALRMRWNPIDVIALGHGLDLIDAALARVFREAPRPDVRAAVRDAIAAARTLQPAPRNRHERRKVAALRRRGEIL